MDVYSLEVPGSGGKTCSQIFEEAGCDTPASPSCGACMGGPRDTYGRMNELMASFSFPFFAPSRQHDWMLSITNSLFICFLEVDPYFQLKYQEKINRNTKLE
jgi:hypothetical protein